MNDIKSLSHTKWECKYHITWIPKYRKKKFNGDFRIHVDKTLLFWGMTIQYLRIHTLRPCVCPGGVGG